MRKIYLEIELDLDVEKIILKYKNEIILIVNKKRDMPAKNTSHIKL